MTQTVRPKATPPDVEDIRLRAERAVQSRFPGLELLPLVPFTGGTSSLTYLAPATVGDGVVVKAAPAGLRPVRNRDVLRQARVLAALAPIEGVLVPEVYGSDEGAPVEIPPLFVMALLPGESYEPRFTDPADAPSDADVRARAEQAATMLARMHTASTEELGLTEEPVTSLTDEIGKWRTAAASCELSAEVAALEAAVHDALHSTAPEPLPPAVLHGDWRLGNMQCQGAQVLGVIDWEIWSVGDPRVDLAWMQLMADPAHPSATWPQAFMVTPDELASAYSAAAGRDVPALDWFGALVRYKQAAASMLLVKNAARRGDTNPRWQRMDDAIAGLLRRAQALLTS